MSGALAEKTCMHRDCAQIISTFGFLLCNNQLLHIATLRLQPGKWRSHDPSPRVQGKMRRRHKQQLLARRLSQWKQRRRLVLHAVMTRRQPLAMVRFWRGRRLQLAEVGPRTVPSGASPCTRATSEQASRASRESTERTANRFPRRAGKGRVRGGPRTTKRPSTHEAHQSVLPVVVCSGSSINRTLGENVTIEQVRYNPHSQS